MLVIGNEDSYEIVETLELFNFFSIEIRLVDGLEVVFAASWVGDHGLGIALGVPVGGADLAVLVGVLEGLNQAQGLVDGATDGQVVNLRATFMN